MEQITIREIAKLCGVGVSTVSRAINNHPDINEETKKKIMDIIKENHYIPNNSARNLKRSDSNAIAVLVKEIGNPFWGKILDVMSREILKKKYSLILQNVQDEEDEVKIAVQLQMEKRLKGIVFLGGMFSYDKELLKRLTIPFVLSTTGRKLPDVPQACAMVSAEGEKESYTMIDYLCRCGHKRIVLLTTLKGDTGLGKSHLEGYKRALEKNGVPFDENLIEYLGEGKQIFSIENGYRAVKKLMENGLDFTCIYAISDILAMGACKAVMDAGKRVPEDISIAGSDGLEIAEYYNPSITTIFKQREQMAEESIRILFDMIEGKAVKPVTLLQGKLVKRESTRSILEN